MFLRAVLNQKKLPRYLRKLFRDEFFDISQSCSKFVKVASELLTNSSRKFLFSVSWSQAKLQNKKTKYAVKVCNLSKLFLMQFYCSRAG